METQDGASSSDNGTSSLFGVQAKEWKIKKSRLKRLMRERRWKMIYADGRCSGFGYIMGSTGRGRKSVQGPKRN